MDNTMYVVESKDKSESVSDILKANNKRKIERLNEYEKELTQLEKVLDTRWNEYRMAMGDENRTLQSVQQAEYNVNKAKLSVIKTKQKISGMLENMFYIEIIMSVSIVKVSLVTRS